MRGREVLSIAAISVFIATGGLPALAAATDAPSGSPGDGLKRSVAVYQFQTSDTSAGSADALTALLTDALVHDGRFVVVEREDLANIATEQQLGAQHSTTEETAAAPGKMIGASLIIRGSVTKFEPNASSSSLSLGVPVGLFGTGNADVKGGHAVVAISLRVIDTTTGQVLTTVKAEGTASTRQADVGATTAAGGALTASTLKTTPLGKAAEEAIDKAVPELALAAEHAPWSAYVIEVDAGKVYVDAGGEENVQPGMVLHVRHKTKDLIDPKTGVVLDTLMSDVGTIRIDAVRPKTSTAVIVDGAPPERGDLLQAQ